MTTERIEFLTPVGRIVAGDVWEPRTEDFQGNQLTIKSGPNAGQPRQEYYIGLAIPKNHPEFPALYAKIVQAARAGFPNLFDAAGNCMRADFAFKIIDGDSTVLNRNNNRPCDKEGYPGHWVLNMSTSLGIKAYDSQNKQIPAESKSIKCGDYVRVFGSVAPNGNAQNPGVFLNPTMLQFSHQGDAISTGISAEQAFGSAPMPAAPAGAITTPAPALAAMPTGNVAAPAATVTVPATSTPIQPSVAAPAVANVQPAPDFLNPAPAAPAVEEKFLIQGAVYTRAQLHASGWNDTQINSQPRA